MRAAFLVRFLDQGTPVEVEDVEEHQLGRIAGGDPLDVGWAGEVDPVLQQPEARPTGFVVDHHLAVQDRGLDVELG